MTTILHDFGAGPIPARRHTNPDGSEGGWVALTAKIGIDVWISASASLGNGSSLGDGSSLGNNSHLGNYSHLGNGSRLGNGVMLDESPPYSQCGRWPAYWSAPGVMRIGCQVIDLDGDTDAIGEALAADHNATPLEIAFAHHALSLSRDFDAHYRANIMPWRKR